MARRAHLTKERRRRSSLHSSDYYFDPECSECRYEQYATSGPQRERRAGARCEGGAGVGYRIDPRDGMNRNQKEGPQVLRVGPLLMRGPGFNQPIERERQSERRSPL